MRLLAFSFFVTTSYSRAKIFTLIYILINSPSVYYTETHWLGWIILMYVNVCTLYIVFNVHNLSVFTGRQHLNSHSAQRNPTYPILCYLACSCIQTRVVRMWVEHFGQLFLRYAFLGYEIKILTKYVSFISSDIHNHYDIPCTIIMYYIHGHMKSTFLNSLGSVIVLLLVLCCRLLLVPSI